MSRRLPHPPEVRARVIAEWQLGKAKSQIARELALPRPTVVSMLRNLASPVLDTEKQEDIGELVYVLCLEIAKGATAIARKLQDPGWLERQSADHIAIAFGVAIDKMAGLLGAIKRGHDQQPAGYLEAPAETSGVSEPD